MQEKTITLQDINPEFYKSENKKCLTCKYMRQISGTHHIRCVKEDAHVNLNNHGVKNGWALYPFNMDPIWVEDCDSYVNKVTKVFQDKDELELLIQYRLSYILFKMNNIKSVSFINKMQEVMEDPRYIKGKGKNESSIEEMNDFYNLLSKV